jgi:ABC-type multidrug transport system ATPase subunit
LDKIIVKLENFEKRYGKIKAVKPLNLEIQRGESFAFMGPNGSGKSTIIKTIAGLQFPTAGQICINGKKLADIKPDDKQEISYMPQRVTMPGNLTPLEITTLFARLRGVEQKRVTEILEYVALEDSMNRYMREFSGGMLQRVGLAVTFLCDCDIYILDEPTLNLDPLGIKRFRELINKLKKEGKTIIFASHLIEDAIQLADRVGILIEGHLGKIESISNFKDEIAREMYVRLKLSEPLEGIHTLLEKSGTKNIGGNGKLLTFQAAPKDRLSIIRSIEAAGGTIEEFHTDPPNWEMLIRHRFKNNENYKSE